MMVDFLVHANTPGYKFSREELCLALEAYLNNKGLLFPSGKRAYYAGHDHLYFFIDIPNPNERVAQEAQPTAEPTTDIIIDEELYPHAHPDKDLPMISGKSDLIDIALDRKHETDAAFLVSDGITECWLPKSQCEDNGDGTFTMPEWLAKEKGLL